MLNVIRRTVRSYLTNVADLSEYYHGLTLYLLGALKFKNLNHGPEHPLPKQVAFWGATLAYYLLTTSALEIDQPPPLLAALIDQLEPVVSIFKQPYLVREAKQPLSLDVAEHLLAALPLEAVPTLGALPANSRMPLSRNPLFVGRQPDLQQLAKALQSDESAGGQIRTVVVTGLGGLGKTQLASEFVHRYGRFFAGGVFWLSFADVKAVPAEVAACGGTKAMALRPDFDKLSLEEQVRLVKTAWQHPLPRLLIFDNCDDPELLAGWRPASGGCRILVTSRYADWDVTLGVQVWPLEVLQRAESIALLREHRPDAAEATLEAIAREVGDLPLALHLAGSYLARYRRSIDPNSYLAQLRETSLLQHPSLQSGGISPTGHIQNISRTIALSYNRLDLADPIDKLALALLAHAVCLAPGEPIPYNLLRLTLNLGQEQPNTMQAKAAVARLAELGLLRPEVNNAVRLHRLVVAFVREAMDKALEKAQAAVELALAEEAERLNKAGYPAVLLAWQVHLRAVTNAAADRDDEQAARLCHITSEHFRQIGDFTRARVCLERAVAIRRKVFGEEHEITARSLTELGGILYDQDDLDAAHSCYKQALAIQEKLLGDHPDTAMTLNHIGFLLQCKDELDAARPYHERALAIRYKVLGDEHPLIAQSLCNLAYLDYRKNNFGTAQTYLEKALHVKQKALGHDHFETAQILTYLGELMQTQGDLSSAQKTFMEVLSIQEKVLVEDHPEKALVLNYLGEVLQAQGDLTNAQAHYEAALAIQQKVLGEDHTKTAITLNNLGKLQQLRGELDKARHYYQRAFETLNARFGPDYYLTRLVHDNLKSLDST
jgi:tetratricopeptide (TPR) repeat protein